MNFWYTKFCVLALFQNLSQSHVIVPNHLQNIIFLWPIIESLISPNLCLAFWMFAVLKLPGGGRRSPLPYLLTLFPPFTLALTSPDIFYQALDFAGTYGGKYLSNFLARESSVFSASKEA